MFKFQRGRGEEAKGKGIEKIIKKMNGFLYFINYKIMHVYKIFKALIFVIIIYFSFSNQKKLKKATTMTPIIK